MRTRSAWALSGAVTRRLDLSEIKDAFEACANSEVIRSVIEFK